jgi:hypothetical protein
MNTTLVNDSRFADWADQDDRMDRLGAELASSVYEVALRETQPQSWLDLELGLWKAITNRLETGSALENRRRGYITFSTHKDNQNDCHQSRCRTTQPRSLQP